MNSFLWLGAASAALLVVSIVLDGWFDALDVFDLGGDWLSLPVLAAVVGAFGFGTGAFYPSMGAPALAIGAAAGIGFGFLTVRLVHAVRGVDAPAATAESMLGAIGRIVTEPTPTTFGEVLIERPDGPAKLACRAAQHLARGTEVVVVHIDSPTLVTVTAFEQEH